MKDKGGGGSVDEILAAGSAKPLCARLRVRAGVQIHPRWGAEGSTTHVVPAKRRSRAEPGPIEQHGRVA